jgi:hypothetical protein
MRYGLATSASKARIAPNAIAIVASQSRIVRQGLGMRLRLRSR